MENEKNVIDTVEERSHTFSAINNDTILDEPMKAAADNAVKPK